MRKSSWRRLLCAFLFCLTAKVAAAQELANLLPEDILGLISLSPVAKARDNIDALSDFLSLPELRNALSTRMGHIFLDENLTAVDTTRGLGLVMLNPQEFNFPYAVVVPVTDFENFVRACAVDSKVYPFSQGNQDLFFARLGEGRIFFGRIPGCAIVSVNQKAVRKIMRAGYFGEKRLYESLSQIERQNLETNPIAFYFNMRMVTESSEGALDTAKFEMLEMAMTETSASKPADGGFQEFSRMQLDCLFALLKEVKSVSGSLKIETDGVRAMVDVTPVSQGPLETLLKSAVGGDVEDYRGLIGKETFAALSWRTDGQAVRNFSVDIARNLATEEAPEMEGLRQPSRRHGPRGRPVRGTGRKSGRGFQTSGPSLRRRRQTGGSGGLGLGGQCLCLASSGQSQARLQEDQRQNVRHRGFWRGPLDPPGHIRLRGGPFLHGLQPVRHSTDRFPRRGGGQETTRDGHGYRRPRQTCGNPAELVLHRLAHHDPAHGDKGAIRPAARRGRCRKTRHGRPANGKTTRWNAARRKITGRHGRHGPGR